jgi:hypothetical protein
MVPVESFVGGKIGKSPSRPHRDDAEKEKRTMSTHASPHIRPGLETVPLLLGGNSRGTRLPEQLLALAASFGMTLLTLTASVG